MPTTPDPASDHVDVLIIGAGLSGIGAAHYLQERLPQKSYAILEARTALGGTWDLFRYPGIRSDSDLSTFSYEFRPWQEDRSIAPAEMILDYLRRTAEEEGIDQRIRYARRVEELSWSSEEGRWTAEVLHTDTGERSGMTATWIFCAGGYYRYDRGHSPVFEGAERFAGTIVHPQFWPEDLDYAGKDVVVIGSGATAMTLVPAMAGTARHVTMVQRTPTYVIPLPSVNPAAVRARARLSPEQAHAANRRRSIRMQRMTWTIARRFPRLARRLIRGMNRKRLPEGYPVDVHFNPPYDPWDQRLCVVPDGDLFHAIGDGSASIATDRIRTFTEGGVQLEGGAEIPADIIVTATGLDLQLFGGVRLRVDGEPVVLGEHVSYRGMMLDGIPNFAYAIGYTNSSWTLKIGLLCEYFARLLAHMDAEGWAVCRPERPAGMATQPLLDFGAGYVQRAIDTLPRQGDRAPWRTSMDYHDDVKLLRTAPVQDGSLRFEAVAVEPGAGDQGEELFCTLPTGIRLCYAVDGPEDGRALLLIAGIGLDMHSWHPSLVSALTEAGFRVIRFDNRDAGRSSRGGARPPGRIRRVFAIPAAADYTLEELAGDALGLLDHLGIADADVVGMSMGGMIGQILAAAHPERVRTLTSIFSTTGDRRVGQPARSTVLALMSPSATAEDGYARGYLALQRHIADGPLGTDRADDERWARRAWRRMSAEPGFVPGAGLARQIAAINKSGDRTASLRRITAPVLVVHGDRDLMVAPSGGAATAEAIPGARAVTIDGLRHHLPGSVSPRLARLVVDHALAAAPRKAGTP